MLTQELQKSHFQKVAMIQFCQDRLQHYFAVIEREDFFEGQVFKNHDDEFERKSRASHGERFVWRRRVHPCFFAADNKWQSVE